MAKCLLFIIFISLSIIFGAYVSISIVDELWDWRLLVREGKYGKLLLQLHQNEQDKSLFKNFALGVFSTEISKRPYPGYLEKLGNGVIFTIKTTIRDQRGECIDSVSKIKFVKIQSLYPTGKKIISNSGGLCEVEYSAKNRHESSNMVLVVETLANNSTKRHKINYTRLKFFAVNEKQSLKLRIAEKTELPLVNRVFLISLQRPMISDISWLQNYYSDLELKNLATNLKKLGVIFMIF